MAEIKIKNSGEQSRESEIEDQISDFFGDDNDQESDQEEVIDEEEVVDEDEEEVNDDDSSDDSKTSEEDESEDEEESEDKTIQMMRDFMNRQAEMLLSNQSPATETQQNSTEKLPELDITQEDYDEALESFDNFKKLMAKTIEVAEQRALIKSKNVVKQSQAQSSIQAKLRQFEEDNKDLQPYTNVVSLTVKNLVKQHPDWSIDDVLKNANKIVRDQLQLHRDDSSKKRKSRNPAKIKKKPVAKRNKGNDQRSDIQKEIDEFLGLT